MAVEIMKQEKNFMLLLHGWGGSGNSEFFPHIKALFKNEIEIISPDMPNPTHPDPEIWTTAVKTAIANQNIKICLCHSLGGTLAMRMISEGLLHPEYLFTVGSSHGPKDNDEMDRFLVPPLKMAALKQLKKFYAIASYDDPATCPEYSTLLVKQAGAIGLFYSNEGHFSNGMPLPEDVIVLLMKAVKSV